MKTQPIDLAELSPEAASVITRLSEFAATYTELTAEFNRYIKDKCPMFRGEMFESDLHLERFNDSARDSIETSLFFIEGVICAARLNKN